MPIEILPPSPQNWVGPGIALQLLSDFVGPLPTGSKWVVEVDNPGDEGGQLLHYETQTQVPIQMIILDAPQNSGAVNTPARSAKDGDTVNIHVQLQTPTSTIDEGSTTGVWTATQGIGTLVVTQHLDALQNSFTTSDRTTAQTTLTNTNTQQIEWDNYTGVTLPSLNDLLGQIFGAVQVFITQATGTVQWTLGQLFSGRTFDLLAPFDLGSACDPETIERDLGGGTFFGVQIEATTVPDWYAFTGPGDAYSQQVLFEVAITRGGNVIYSKGVHERTHMIYPLPGVPLAEINFEMPTIPGDYHISIIPNIGVCVQAGALQFP